MFLVRALILGTAFLFLLTLIFYDRRFFLQNIRGIQVPLLLFSLFILYGFAQWNGGSINRFETEDHVVQLIFYLLFFFLSLHFLSSQKRMRLVMVLVAVETAFLIALGYFQANAVHGGLQQIYGWHPVQKDSQFFSSFFNKNYYGAFLLLASFLLMGPLGYWFRDPRLKWPVDSRHLENLLFVLILPAALVSMLHVRARAAFAVELCAVTLLWLFGFMTGGRKKAFFTFLLFGALTTVLALVLNPSLLEPYRAWHQDILFRFAMWKDSVPLFFDFPYFGTGLGTFKWISRRYQTHLTEDYWVDHVHNDYLELLTDTGIIGFLIFITAIVSLLIFSLRRCLKSASRWNRTIGTVSFMAVVSLGLITTIDFYLRTPAIAMLWVVHLAVLVNCGAMYSGKEEHGSTPGSGSTALKILWVTAGIAFLFFLGKFAYRTYQAQVIFDRYEQAASSGSRHVGRGSGMPRALQTQALMDNAEELTKAVLAMPEDPKGWKLLGDLYLRKATSNPGRLSDKYFRKSIEAYGTLTKLAPTRPDAWLRLGKAQLLHGDWKAGFKNMRQGLSYSPYNRDIYLTLVVDYLRTAEILTDSKEEREACIQEAASLIKSASSLKRPFTVADFDYIGSASGKLSGEDQSRVWRLLDN